VAVAAILFVGPSLDLAAAQTSSSPSAATSAQVVALVAKSTSINQITSAMITELTSGTASEPVAQAYNLPNPCYYSATDQSQNCVYGDTSSSRSIVLYGESHARMWFPAINSFAIAHQLKLILVGADGCLALLESAATASFPWCAAPNSPTAFLNDVKAISPPPIAVIIGARNTYNVISSAVWQLRLTQTVKALQAIGSKVAIMGDSPQFNSSVPDCLASYPTSVQKHCAIHNPNPRFPGQRQASLRAAKATGALFIDVTPWLCTSSKCSPVVGPFIVYTDTNHLSVAYVQYLSKVIAAALQPLL
jgi:hypothetical protein